MRVRRVSVLFVTLILGVSLLAACSASEDARDGAVDADQDYPARTVREGQALYGRTCTVCHGPDGRGVPNLGKDLVQSTFVDESSDDELVAFVRHGRAADDPLNTTGIAMPPKGGYAYLTDDDIRAIIAYLRTGLIP
jgi:cytochrome c5